MYKLPALSACMLANAEDRIFMGLFAIHRFTWLTEVYCSQGLAWTTSRPNGDVVIEQVSYTEALGLTHCKVRVTLLQQSSQ